METKAGALPDIGGVRFAIDVGWPGVKVVETVPEATQVLPRALEVAGEIAANVSPMASMISRALLWEGASSPENAHLLESQVFHGLIGSRYTITIFHSSFLL